MPVSIKTITHGDLHDRSALDEAELHKRNFQKILPASKMEPIVENCYDNMYNCKNISLVLFFSEN